MTSDIWTFALHLHKLWAFLSFPIHIHYQNSTFAIKALPICLFPVLSIFSFSSGILSFYNTSLLPLSPWRLPKLPAPPPCPSPPSLNNSPCRLVTSVNSRWLALQYSTDKLTSYLLFISLEAPNRTCLLSPLTRPASRHCAIMEVPSETAMPRSTDLPSRLVSSFL